MNRINYMHETIKRLAVAAVPLVLLACTIANSVPLLANPTKTPQQPPNGPTPRPFVIRDACMADPQRPKDTRTTHYTLDDGQTNVTGYCAWTPMSIPQE